MAPLLAGQMPVVVVSLRLSWQPRCTGRGGFLLVQGFHRANQIKLLLPKFHRNRTRKYNNTALFGGGCWASLTGRFHQHSAAGWAECTVAHA